ncbi:hypothetical protein NSE01_35430 [Novosphingobium sediminis]|uniref:DUF3768 domain-containing protein n=1 Tax=Novosphingobium sediminis TaxID=707214 RepID=A0A512APT5_9SPHN|nr:DUF3768 domain-containing protein [Novosphingobium sediminis]GEO01711.1 hypothetical protein NSE01_35430 [Novosphingobium sediminis]
MPKTNGTTVPRAEAIALLNDKLRKTGKGGSVLITTNLTRITGFDATVLTKALAECGGFDASNNPHGERDFGDLTLWGYDLIWKIDYYDTELQFGSDDPTDPDVTHRVLTVMLASDW